MSEIACKLIEEKYKNIINVITRIMLIVYLVNPLLILFNADIKLDFEEFTKNNIAKIDSNLVYLEEESAKLAVESMIKECVDELKGEIDYIDVTIIKDEELYKIKCVKIMVRNITKEGARRLKEDISENLEIGQDFIYLEAL